MRDMLGKFWMMGGGGSSLPYTADDNTYLWNFAAANITVDETGTDTIADVPEMARGTSHSFANATKATQPLLNANGAEFVAADSYTIETSAGGTPPLNAAHGLYAAMLVNRHSATSTANLIKVYGGYNKARNGRFHAIEKGWALKEAYGYGAIDDGNGWTKRMTPSVGTPMDTWALLEWKYDLQADTVQFWLDGVENVSVIQDTVFGGPTAYASTDSLGILIGMSNMDGVVKGVAVYDGIIPDDNRQSISDYLMSLKP